MISISRRLVGQLRTVFKHALGRATRGSTGPFVYLQVGPDGLHIRAAGPDVSIEYHEPGQYEPVLLAIPLALLAECEGAREEQVHFEITSDGAIRVHWQDRAIPQSRLLTATPPTPENFPPVPADLTINEPEILDALREASAIAVHETSRYALGCIALKGRAGKIGATDGRQLLIQSGYEFPWNDELLIPASKVFGCRQFALGLPVRTGISESHVSLATGPWTIHCKINRDGRFPKVDDCIPDVATSIGRITVDPSDAEFLGAAIQRLPETDHFNRPVTLDLNGQVGVRATAEDQSRPTELVLVNSGFSGDPTQICMDRRFLARAANLKFGELYVFGKDKPMLACDARRQMVWAVLDADATAQAVADSVRIESPPAGAQVKPSASRLSPMGAQRPMAADSPPTAPQTTRRRSGRITQKPAQATPIEQAVAVKLALRESLGKVNELVRILRRQKRLSRLARTTLASLKELQKVA